jgi:hypothetical protein
MSPKTNFGTSAKLRVIKLSVDLPGQLTGVQSLVDQNKQFQGFLFVASII